MDQKRTWNLFALKLAGKATPEEWAELQQIMEEEPKIALHLQALTNFWHQHSKYDKQRIEKAVNKIAENHAVQHGSQELFEEKAALISPATVEKNRNGFWLTVKRQLKQFIQLIVNNMPT